MNGKEWFIVGTRLMGLGIIFMGFQQGMTFVTRGMLFANVDRVFMYDSTPPYTYLFHGALISAFGLFLLLKADTLAAWCYDKPAAPPPTEPELEDDLPDIRR